MQATRSHTKLNAAISGPASQPLECSMACQLSAPPWHPACFPSLPSPPRYMEVENTEVLRAHLRSSTFVSGSSEPGYKERRGYKGLRRRS